MYLFTAAPVPTAAGPGVGANVCWWGATTCIAMAPLPYITAAVVVVRADPTGLSARPFTRKLTSKPVLGPSNNNYYVKIRSHSWPTIANSNKKRGGGGKFTKENLFPPTGPTFKVCWGDLCGGTSPFVCIELPMDGKLSRINCTFLRPRFGHGERSS